MNSPWQSNGVSLIPEKLNDLMPIVGQGRLLNSLRQFRNQIIDPSGKQLTGFYMVIGGWGVGKSRVGHEVCLEGVSEDVNWIIDSKPERLLDPNLQQGILPLFVRYIQITKGPFGGKIGTDNWIPIAVLESLSRLAGIRETGGHRQKNQDRLMDLTRKALMPKGWDSILPELQKVLQEPNPHDAVREAIAILKEIGINHLWLVVDEIEDITDVERDGLPTEERQGIDQALLTVIPRVIKAEETRQEFPEVNFLLLCSQAVGDLMRQIRAIERRTGWHELTTNTFSDVEAFFRYLIDNRPLVAKTIESYPKGLKEAVFFAANRNFGWFNVIMHYAHQNFREGKMDTSELLRKFAEDSAKGQAKSVFNLDAISEYRIQKDADYADVVRSMFALLPRQIGAADGVSDETAVRYLSKVDSGGSARHLFVKVREITPPAKHTILAHLIRCGFKNESGTELILPGEVRFDLQLVVDSLEAYSIALPEERRSNLLISEDPHEFEAQVSGLSPYAEHASDFSPFLHGLFMDPSYLVKSADGAPIIHLGPAFTFLLEFNRLNKMRKAEDGYLRDNAANSRLEEGYQSTVKDNGKRTKCILAGLVNAWEIERAPITTTSIPSLKLPAIRFVSSSPPPGQCNPLNLGRDGEAIVIYAGTASNPDLEPDLTKLAKEAARPIIVILEEQDQRIQELRDRLNRNVPRIAPFITIHNLARQTAEHLIRLGLMGDAFMKDDLRTSHFHAAIGVAKDHLRRNLEEIWLKEQIEEQGLLLRPIFFGGKTSDDEFRILAKGYAGMLDGTSFHDVCQVTSGVFIDDRERDLFKNMVVRHVDPGPKYKGRKRFELFADQSGEYVVCVPRPILSILDRCGNVAMSRSDLENHFLFEIPEDLKTKDVLRHISAFMQYLGLLEPEGDKVQRVSSHKLEQWVKRSRDWLEGPFEERSRAIKAIYQKEGEELLDVKAKDARHRLKESEKKLESLSLDFIGKPWTELNKMTSDEIPLYEQKLRTSLRIIREVRSAVEWVYDHERVNDFRYSNDLLQEFEAQEKAPSYPLWKRIVVLAEFYKGLDKKRKELIKQMEGIASEVDKRVPDISTGEKAFPTQVVTMPLRTYKQELEFSAEKPEKTIVVGATTLGITTVGYKLASSNYVEALGRLDAIEADLNQPGKLVQSFMEQLKTWEGLRAETSALKREVDTYVHFFTDAPAVVSANYNVADVQREFSEIFTIIEEGGIREGTDNRETAGTRAFDLIHGLEEDVRKIKDLPSQLKQKIRDRAEIIIPSLIEEYTRKYGSRLIASTKIRSTQNMSPLSWPDQKENTYGKTSANFDALVAKIDKEGAEFFAGSADTTFDTLVGLCQMELDKKVIDWDGSEFKRHIDMLRGKKLLTLRLI